MSTDKPLSSRVAWVTGSSRGLGRVMATHLCRLGARVAVHGTRPDSPRSFGEGESMEQVARDVAAEAGGVAMPVWGDVTDEATVKRMAGEMMARKQGRIITIGSIAGCFGRDDGAIYSVAKAGVHEYTRCLAVQLRPYNVPVNCVAPGGTVTNRFLVIHDVDQKKLVEEGTLDRYGRPDEVADVVAALASEAGRFISGQVIRVDGGSQCWPA